MHSLLLLAGKGFALLFIFFLPGYLTGLFLKQKESFSLLISILLSSLVGLFLAQIGSFSLPHLVLPLAFYSITLFTLLCFKKPETLNFKKTWRRENRFLLAVMVLALFLFFRPHQYLEGGWDPGTYLNTGINIARTGSIKIEDKTWASLEKEEQEIFSHTRVNIQQKYPAFMVSNSETGLIIPRFYHLYPVWIAIFYSLFGLRFSLYVNPFFALLGLMAFYQAARVLFNRPAARLAVLFLALSPIYIWYARFSTSEMLTQFLLWNGIYALALYEDRNEPFLGVIGAAALGTALFASLTTILILPGVILYFFYRNWGKFKHSDLFFIVPFTFLLLYLLFQTIFLTKDYIYNVYWYHYKFNPVTAKVIIGLTAGLIGLFLLKIFSRRVKPFCQRLCQKQYIRGAGALAIILLALYAYFLRPRVMASNVNAANLKELALFLTPFGVWLAIFGMASMFWQGFSRKKALFIIISLTFSVLFLRNKVLAPSYPWALRRYVPLIIPSFYLLSAYLIMKLSLWRKILGQTMGITAGLYLLILPVSRGFPLIKQVDYRGMIEFSEKLAGQMKEEALYVCDGYWLATPLHYIYGKNTLSLSDQNIPKSWQSLLILEKWLKQGKQVFYISREEKPFTPRIDFQEMASADFQSSRLEHPLRQLPREIKRIKAGVKIFQLKLLSERIPLAKGKNFIDIGRNCFGLAGGFAQARTYSGGINARWTYEVAEVVIPWPEEDSEVILMINMGGRRPKEEKLARVSLYLDKTLIKELELSNELEEYRFILPSSIIQPLFPQRAVLRIESTTWNPYQYGIKGYGSDLGVILDWIKVEF